MGEIKGAGPSTGEAPDLPQELQQRPQPPTYFCIKGGG